MDPAAALEPGVHLRDEFDWVGALSTDGERRDAALGDLRDFLFRGLRRAFPDRQQKTSLALEDCVQESLVRITAGLPKFSGDSRFTTWAMSIAVRTLVSESRRAHWRDVSLEQLVESGRGELARDYDGDAGENGIARQRLFKLVRDVVTNGLTDKQRQAVEAELTGAPPEEVARRMNMSRNALYKLTYDARVKLRRSILKSGWTEAEVRQIVGSANV